MVLNHLNKKQKISWVITTITVVILLLLTLVLVLSLRKNSENYGESTTTLTSDSSSSDAFNPSTVVTAPSTAVTTPTTNTAEEITTTENRDLVIFLSENQVLSLPNFEKIECKMDQLSVDKHFGLAGKVTHGGQERLMIGGFEIDFWFMRTESGWERVADNKYKRILGAVSSVGSDGLMVTGGFQDSSHYMEIFSDEEWRLGPDLPEPDGKQNHCQVTFQGKPYIIGGHVGNERNVR